MNKVRFDEIEKDISKARDVIKEAGSKQQTMDERLTKLLGETQLRPVEIRSGLWRLRGRSKASPRNSM